MKSVNINKAVWVKPHVMIFFLLCTLIIFGIVSAVRLPTVGGDSDSWGTTLNDFLNTSLDNNTGYIRLNSGSVFVGNSSNLAWGVPLGGDAVILTNGSFNVTGINGAYLGSTTATSANILIANGSHWITRAVGTDATISNTGALTIALNAVALGTDTTNNYVATVADNGGGTISVTGSGSETADVTIGINSDTIIATQLGDTIDLDTASEAYLFFTANGAGSPGNPTFSFVNDGTSLSAGDDIMKIMFQNLGSNAVNASHTFLSFMTAGGEVGDISGTATPGTIAYNTFTGSHWSETEELNLEEGEVLVSTGVLLKNAQQLTKTSRTTIINDKRVYGVYGGLKGRNNNTWVGEKDLIQVLSLGTGVIRVTDTNGNINNGDLITTSTRAGYGQKQDDDLFHSYTVAKATQSIDWTTIPIDTAKGFKWKLIASTYHAG